jgi:hypothetical protein
MMPRRIEQWQPSPALRYALLLAAVAVYLELYLRHPFAPRPGFKGWFEFWDQAHYLRSAEALSRGVLHGSSHWYPLGYPFVGSLFVAFTRWHLFLIPNLLCFAGILLLLRRLFRAVLPPGESLLLIGLCLVQPLVLEHLLIPWTTIPTQLATYAIIVLLIARRPGQREVIAAAIWAGAMSLFRPGDLLFVMPLFAAALLARGGDPRAWLGDGLRASGIIAGFLALTLAANKAVFGVFWSTPYTQIVGDIGFGISGLALDTYSLLIEARTLYGVDAPMLFPRYPWTLLALPGAVVLVRRWGWRALGLPIAIVSTTLFYLGYRDFDGSTAFKFSTIHYLLWMLPLLTLMSYLTLREGWRWLRLRWLLPLALLPALVAGTIGLELRDLPVRPATLRFAGRPVAKPVLSDVDHASYLEAHFPWGDNIILEASFKEAQPLRVVQLFGWLDNHLSYPGVELDGTWLKPNAHYRPAFGPHGLMIFFKRERRAKQIRIKVNPTFSGRIVVSEVRFARPTLAFGGAIGRWLRAAPESRARAWQLGPGGDRTGPWPYCATQDGTPDQRVALEIDAALGARLSSIELRADATKPARWSVCGGAHELWRLALVDANGATVGVDALQRGGRFTLHAADNGAFALGAPFVIVGYDREAFPLFEIPVARRAPAR